MLSSPLLRKTLLWMLIAGALLTTASLWVFQRVLTGNVVRTVGDELMTSQRVLRQLLDQQQDFLHAVAVNQAEYLSMKPPQQYPDSTAEWAKRYLDMTALDLFQIENGHGAVITSAINSKVTAQSDSDLFKLSGLRFQYDDMYLYQIASAEVPGSGGDKVFVGKRLDSRWLWGLSDITRSRMAVFTGDRFLLVSVDSSYIQPLKASLPWDMVAAERPMGLKLADNEMLVMCEGLPGGPSPDLCVLLLRDLEPEMAMLGRVQRSVGVLAGALLLVLTMVGAMSAARMVRRIRSLDGAARALEDGAPDNALDTIGNDELASLSRRFAGMRLRLRERQIELQDLNKRLEAQMRELRLTQRQLVQSEKLSSVGNLSAQLSHELNNPICNIQNCVEVLRKQGGNGDTQEYVELIRDEVGRMAKLTRQLLDFHRPAKEEFRPTNLNEVADSVLRVSAHQLENKQIEIVRAFTPDIPELWCDSDQIKQVLLNLILNATDAMPDGGALTVATRLDNEHLALDVSDTGVGMDEATREKIFDAFFTTKSAVAGVGLGLFVCYRIVRLHGGFIDVHSAKGKGSTFSVKLPLKPAHIVLDEGVAA